MSEIIPFFIKNAPRFRVSPRNIYSTLGSRLRGSMCSLQIGLGARQLHEETDFPFRSKAQDNITDPPANILPKVNDPVRETPTISRVAR